MYVILHVLINNIPTLVQEHVSLVILLVNLALMVHLAKPALLYFSKILTLDCVKHAVLTARHAKTVLLIINALLVTIPRK